MKQPKFTSNIQASSGVRVGELALALKADPVAFGHKLRAMVNFEDDSKGLLSLEKIRRNVKDLFLAFLDAPEIPTEVDVMGKVQMISTGAFPLLVGNLMVARINSEYAAQPVIGNQLVEDFDSDKKFERIAGILGNEALDAKQVPELTDYPEIGASEESYEIRSKRNGRMVTMSAEAIEENNIADFINRVNATGRAAAELIETQTLRRVCDIDGSAGSAAEPYVLHRNGSPASLYSVTANTPGVRTPLGTRLVNNALVDWTNIKRSKDQLYSYRTDLGARMAIPIDQTVVLVPNALSEVAFTILRSGMTPGVFNEENPYGPNGLYRPKLLVSPRLDDLSTDTWYHGIFNRQFKRKWKLRMEVVTLGMNTTEFLKKRIAFQGRVGWDCEIGANDYAFAVQNLAGTSAPTP